MVAKFQQSLAEKNNKPGLLLGTPDLLQAFNSRKTAAVGSNANTRRVGGHEHDNHDEETLKRHLEDIDRELAAKKISEEEARREKEEAIKERLAEREKASPDGRTALHVAASDADFPEVEKLLQNHNTDMLNARDENGWQAIHEAVRAGSLEIVK